MQQLGGINETLSKTLWPISHDVRKNVIFRAGTWRAARGDSEAWECSRQQQAYGASGHQFQYERTHSANQVDPVEGRHQFQADMAQAVQRCHAGRERSKRTAGSSAGSRCVISPSRSRSSAGGDNL